MKFEFEEYHRNISNNKLIATNQKSVYMPPADHPWRRKFIHSR